MIRDIVIDCHSDTLLKKYYEQSFVIGEREQIFHVSKDLLLQGGIDIQVFAIFVPPKLEKLGVEISLEMLSIAREMEKDGFSILYLVPMAIPKSLNLTSQTFQLVDTSRLPCYSDLTLNSLLKRQETSFLRFFVFMGDRVGGYIPNQATGEFKRLDKWIKSRTSKAYGSYGT